MIKKIVRILITALFVTSLGFTVPARTTFVKGDEKANRIVEIGNDGIRNSIKVGSETVAAIRSSNGRFLGYRLEDGSKLILDRKVYEAENDPSVDVNKHVVCQTENAIFYSVLAIPAMNDDQCELAITGAAIAAANAVGMCLTWDIVQCGIATAVAAAAAGAAIWACRHELTASQTATEIIKERDRILEEEQPCDNVLFGDIDPFECGGDWD